MMAYINGLSKFTIFGSGGLPLRVDHFVRFQAGPVVDVPDGLIVKRGSIDFCSIFIDDRCCVLFSHFFSPIGVQPNAHLLESQSDLFVSLV